MTWAPFAIDHIFKSIEKSVTVVCEVLLTILEHLVTFNKMRFELVRQTVVPLNLFIFRLY